MSTVEDPRHEASAPRKRMLIFRAADAQNAQDHMPSIGIDETVRAGLAKLAEASAGYPVDSGAKALLLFKEPGEHGMSLTYVWFKSGFILPRHSHNADCLYYVLAGELRMGSQVLRKGDGFFIPADAGYTYEAGPEGVEVLELRNATQFHFKFTGNDATHWERIANAVRANSPRWQTEPPPSAR
jgi:quercetin dioxygenase-like cupin family protein